MEVETAPGGTWREVSSVCLPGQQPGDERAVVRVVNDGLEVALARRGYITDDDLAKCSVPSVAWDSCIILGASERRLQPDCVLPEKDGRTRGGSVFMAACGGLHSAAVTDEGLLFTWGAGGMHICDVRRHEPTLTNTPSLPPPHHVYAYTQGTAVMDSWATAVAKTNWCRGACRSPRSAASV